MPTVKILLQHGGSAPPARWGREDDSYTHAGYIECEAPLSDLPGWRAFLRLEVDGSALIVSELRVFPEPPPWPPTHHPARVRAPEGGLTSRMLRSVRLGELVEAVTAHLRQDLESMGINPDTRAPKPPPGGFELTALPKGLLAARPSRPGRAGQGDFFYAVWAARYDEKSRCGSRSPLVELAEEHNLRRGQVRDLIHEARRRGLLTKGARGRPGGVLTPKALEVLANEEGN